MQDAIPSFSPPGDGELVAYLSIFYINKRMLLYSLLVTYRLYGDPLPVDCTEVCILEKTN